jgi:hypothetical protein
VELFTRLVRNSVPKEYLVRAHWWLVSDHRRLSVYARLRPVLRPQMVTDETRLVIEGYPRCANSYALAAFRVANGQGCHVAHHLHTPVSIAAGAARNIPVLFLIRHPLEAVTSQLIRYPTHAPRSSLLRYSQFYAGVEPFLDHVVVARFENVIADFGAITERVNQRFGTRFVAYDRTTANEAKVRQMIEAMDREFSPDGTVREHMVSRPSAARSRLASRVSERILSSCARELEQAVGRYNRVLLVAEADEHRGGEGAPSLG